MAFEATVEQVRYWVPQIKDVARVVEDGGPEFWKLTIAPFTATACPVEMTVHADRRFDVVLAGQSYLGRPLPSESFIVPFLEQIAEGRVVQRRWTSRATGSLHAIETIVTLAGDAMRLGGDAAIAVDGDTLECREHHFLPYRR